MEEQVLSASAVILLKQMLVPLSCLLNALMAPVMGAPSTFSGGQFMRAQNVDERITQLLEENVLMENRSYITFHQSKCWLIDLKSYVTLVKTFPISTCLATHTSNQCKVYVLIVSVACDCGIITSIHRLIVFFSQLALLPVPSFCRCKDYSSIPADPGGRPHKIVHNNFSQCLTCPFSAQYLWGPASWSAYYLELCHAQDSRSSGGLHLRVCEWTDPLPA